MNYELSLLHSRDELQPCDHLDYRNFHMDFFEDCLGQQVWTYWRNKPLGFGTDNWNYKDDTKALIDDLLDTITRFEQYPKFTGAKLTWFQNGEFRDIKLTYRDRLLKVFLVVDESLVNLTQIIADSIIILDLIVIEE